MLLCKVLSYSILLQRFIFWSMSWYIYIVRQHRRRPIRPYCKASICPVRDMGNNAMTKETRENVSRLVHRNYKTPIPKTEIDVWVPMVVSLPIHFAGQAASEFQHSQVAVTKITVFPDIWTSAMAEAGLRESREREPGERREQLGGW